MSDNFAITLNKFIKGSNLNVHNLAESLNVEPSVMDDILDGKVIPPARIILYLSDVLGLTKYETEFLFFLAKKVPPECKMFSSFRFYQDVLDVAENKFPDVTFKESNVISPIYQVTTPGEICHYWQKTNVSMLFKHYIPSKCFRKAGRTKLVLLSSVINAWGFPPVKLPFSFDPSFDDVSILNDVLIVGELCSKYDVKRGSVLSVVRFNDMYNRFSPDDGRKSGGDWLFLEKAFQRVFKK